MKEKKISILYYTGFYLLLVIVLIYAEKGINVYVVISPLVFLTIDFYFREIRESKVTVKRKEKIHELLIEKYGNGKKNSEGDLECLIKNRNIIFKYHTCLSHKGYVINNFLTLYMDISNIESDIKELCKIHFFCSKIDSRDCIYSPVGSSLFSNSLKTLVKNSENALESIIGKSDIYIQKKRRKTKEQRKL
ncbi:hypothetical protein [Arcticibacterium luteifluviistationis]|uniref:Uncharacterized protein n=1 Tax=Arcticibacterium luteifluviistationis TaxID=1784714 RepID=A0A2Z4G7A0_9BACT|nr:hypothetical protein [Arcticibacterium luteifluviistationis]AWV97044.1 hypothetical protein DJ013_02165 [Arcticibacterium luteifluviistationis]